MKNLPKIGLLVALLAIPGVAFGVAEGMLAYTSYQFRQGAAEAFAGIKNPTPIQQKLYDLFRQTSAEQLCDNQKVRSLDPNFEKACEEIVDPLTTLLRAAKLAAICGIGLILSIWMCGVIAGSSRTMLVITFLPGLYLTLLTLTCLVALHAALLIASLYFICVQFFERIPVGIMAAIGFGALLGIVAMIRSLFGTVRRAETKVLGRSRELTPGDPLEGFLSHLTQQIGTTMPDNVVVGFTPNFFVTEAKVRCIDGLLTGRTLYLSLPLARILTQPELGAILGHELGHFKGSDTRFSRWFYPIYRGTGQALQDLSQVARSEGSKGLAVLPSVYALNYFLSRFAAAESRLSREREILADAVGARATNPRACASALMKVHAFAPLWTNLYEEMREMLDKKKQFINASSYWASKVATGLRQQPNFLAEIDTSTTDVGHPTDTHPSLGVRLNALQVPPGSIIADASQCEPQHPAIELIPEHDRLEKDLTDIETSVLLHSVGGNNETYEQPATSAPPEAEKLSSNLPADGPSTASSTDDSYQARARELAELLRWWRVEIAIPSDAPDSAKAASTYDMEDVEIACQRVADSHDDTSLRAALQSLASRADAARRLAIMFKSFTSGLSGQMLELTTETARLLDNLATRLMTIYDTSIESINDSTQAPDRAQQKPKL